MKSILLLPFILFSSIIGVSQSLNDSLKAFYRFDNNLVDSSGNSNHLQIRTGSISYVNWQQNNTVASFNGSSSLRSINNFNNTNYTQTSISYWIKTSTIKNSRQIVLQGSFLGFGELIEQSSNKLRCWYDGSSSSTVKSLAAITDGSWHHIVHQSNGATTDLYIDGTLNTRVAESFNVGIGDTNEYIFIGATYYGIENFTGQIDDVRIYNRILTQAEIITLSQPITTSIQENTISEYDLKVFPNPTNGDINLIINKNQIGSILSIKNILGQSIYSERVTEIGKLNIELHGESGIYFVELIDSNGNRNVTKLIIQ